MARAYVLFVPCLWLAHCSLDGLSGGSLAGGTDGGADTGVDADVAKDTGSADSPASGRDSAEGDARLPDAGFDCSVHADGKLYCTNRLGASMYAMPFVASGVVNHLRMTYSYFECWGTGELHAGGNTTWYRTIGDDNANRGWVAAVDLNTPDTFDADPSAHGLVRCP